jgi:hypothetical protein
MQAERTQFFIQTLVQALDGFVCGHGNDKDTAELGLDNGLADVFDIAVFFKKYPGDGGDDARPVRSEDRDDGFVHCPISKQMVIFVNSNLKTKDVLIPDQACLSTIDMEWRRLPSSSPYAIIPVPAMISGRAGAESPLIAQSDPHRTIQSIRYVEPGRS